jgi:sporulation protein YlmC with PRC-barrel domain
MAPAASETVPPLITSPNRQNMTTQLLSCSSLCGDKVRNTKGEHLGEIKELMIDLQKGSVEYGVLSFGGILGLGDKLFAVPWGAMALDTAEKVFVLDVDKEYLKKAPGFDKDRWPDFASPAFRKQHHSYYRVKLASH